MTSGCRFSVSVSAEIANVLYRQLEHKSMEQAQNSEYRAAKLPENLMLNRWHNVLPYDATRVKLNPIYPGKFGTDYINASYVNVPEANRCYILTQGPLKETIWHFWLMVYQCECPAIIMLCRLTENGFCKCARYWPETTKHEDIASDNVTGFEIKLLSEEETQDLVIRKIELRHIPSKTVRTVTQYHYNKWPDFGVPTEPTNFLRLLHRVANDHPSVKEHPNVVHCSAGIGRSGTFCLVDSCIQIMTKRQGPMTRHEIVDTLLHMRSCRSGLVQTPEQLRFSLYALTVAMGSMDFLNDASEKHKGQSNGIKVVDPERVRRDSDSKNSSTISTESNTDDSACRNKPKHARKRSTADEDSSMEKDDELIEEPETVGRENGESQAKRSKGNKDWWPWPNWGPGGCQLLWFVFFSLRHFYLTKIFWPRSFS